MSLILEALRKSEAERRRSDPPSLHGQLPPVASPSRTPAAHRVRGWLALAVVLVLGGGIYAWSTRKPEALAPPHSPSVTQARPVAAPTQALPPVKHLTSAPAAAGKPRPVVREASPPSALPIAPVPKTPVEPFPAPVAPVAPPAVAAGGGMLHLSDLDPEQRKALPPLKLSMHMWNDDPAQRFVILDGNRLREGDRLGDAVVTAITREGVVLDWDGRRLLVPIR